MNRITNWYKIRIIISESKIDDPYVWCIENIDQAQQIWTYDYIGHPIDDFFRYDYFFENDNDALLFRLTWE